MIVKPNSNVQIKHSNNQKGKIPKKSNKNNFIKSICKKEIKSPPKVYSKLCYKKCKANSKSSNQNKTEMNTTRLKVKKEQKMKELTFENKNLSNFLQRKKKINITTSKNSSSKVNSHNNFNITKNNSKKNINYHYSFFIDCASNKYKRNLISFNINSDSMNNINLNNKTINYTVNNFIGCKNNLFKNMTKKNSIKKINSTSNKRKPKNYKKYNSNNKLLSVHNIKLNKQFILEMKNKNNNTNIINNKNSSVSKRTSKEKNNYNNNTKYVEVNLKEDNIGKNYITKIEREKCFIIDKKNLNKFSGRISKDKNNINSNRKKKVNNNKINSRNNNNRRLNISINNFQYLNNSNINSNNKSTIINLKHINSNIMNYIRLNNKTKNIEILGNKSRDVLKEKKSFDKYYTVTQSPNSDSNKKLFLNFLNISKMIDENKKIKEKNDSLSSEINVMSKEFENMKKENMNIKRELKEKSKMIKDIKLTIDIFNQELKKLQKLSKNNLTEHLNSKDSDNDDNKYK